VIYSLILEQLLCRILKILRVVLTIRF